MMLRDQIELQEVTKKYQDLLESMKHFDKDSLQEREAKTQELINSLRIQHANEELRGKDLTAQN